MAGIIIAFYASAYLSLLWIIPLLYFLILTYASLNIRLNFYLPSINSFKSNNHEVAITFDDGPTEKTTLEILNILEEFGVKASFFCTGKNIAKHPEILRTINDGKHSIGNHGYGHNNLLPLKSFGKQLQDVEKCMLEIEQITQKKTKLYRPPFGVTNPRIAKVIRRLDLRSIGWSVRSLDTLNLPGDMVVKQIVSRTKPGDIILFHDNRSATPGILREVLEQLREKNFNFITADELLSRL